MLIKNTVEEFIKEAGSDSPTPGGGSVSALAGSLGAALTTMVANLSFDKKSYKELNDDIKIEFDKNYKELLKLTDDLKSIVDEDSTAFDGVMAAFKLPKETEEEKSIRRDAIQKGYIKAMEVPNRCADLCLKTLKLQKVFADYGNINAITDVGVGSLLAYSGLEGALLNVKINLLSIKDETYRKDIEGKMTKSLEDGKSLKEEILSVVYRRLEE